MDKAMAKRNFGLAVEGIRDSVLGCMLIIEHAEREQMEDAPALHVVSNELDRVYVELDGMKALVEVLAE